MPKHGHVISVILLVIGGLAGSVVAQAQDAATGGWTVTVGGALAYAPTFEGARTYAPTIVPSFDIRRAGEPATFSAPDDNFGITILEFGGIEVGPLAAVRFGRPAGAIGGLPGYSWSFRTGGFVEFWPVEGVIRTRAETLYGLNANDGWTENLAADLVTKTGLFTWAVGPRVSFADTSVMQTEFGVSALAAAANPKLTPFTAYGGTKSAGIAASVSYDWSKDWTVNLFGNYDRLMGAAAASPITRQLGSANQGLVGLGFEHSFTFTP